MSSCEQEQEFRGGQIEPRFYTLSNTSMGVSFSPNHGSPKRIHRSKLQRQNESPLTGFQCNETIDRHFSLKFGKVPSQRFFRGTQGVSSGVPFDR